MLNRIREALNLSPQDLNEAPTSKVVTIPNGQIARSLDFTEDMNDPSVRLVGYGDMKISTLKKDIRNDLNRLGDSVGVTDAKYLMVAMSDFTGRKTSGNLVAFKMAGLAEVEEFMKLPATKRKISLMKKK
jgi:hypothetical protein